jgi:hypothetical protein
VQASLREAPAQTSQRASSAWQLCTAGRHPSAHPINTRGVFAAGHCVPASAESQHEASRGHPVRAGGVGGRAAGRDCSLSPATAASAHLAPLISLSDVQRIWLTTWLSAMLTGSCKCEQQHVLSSGVAVVVWGKQRLICPGWLAGATARECAPDACRPPPGSWQPAWLLASKRLPRGVAATARWHDNQGQDAHRCVAQRSY